MAMYFGRSHFKFWRGKDIVSLCVCERATVDSNCP